MPYTREELENYQWYQTRKEARKNAEIYAITEYLYPDGDKKNFNNSSKYIGDA